MYSKLEEASFPLVSDRHYANTKFIKAGTFNPSKISKHASKQSFFVWKLSDKILEIHEITCSKQLKHNRFTYEFAIPQMPHNVDFYLLPHIEFIEYHENGQNMIAFHLLSSNWTLYQFKVLHPQQLSRNLSTLHHLQDTHPSCIQLISSMNPLNAPLSFKMFDLFKILICDSSQLMMLQIDNNENEPFIINTKEAPKSLFSSFLPSALSTASTQCNYVFMDYHKPVASRTIIGCLDNKCHFELYLLSNHKRLNHKILDIPQNAHHLLFYGYRHEYGVCWFSVLIFYESGGAAVLQCQYQQNEDQLVVLNEFESLNEINTGICIDAKVHNNLLWCVLLNNNNDEYDVFFCDIHHYVKNRNTVNAENWKFQRMWKRSEYIHRILNSIQTEFSFDTFYEHCSQEWNMTGAQSGVNRNIESYKHKLHELILNFWLNRLVDDPTLEFNEEVLESQLKQLIVAEQMENHYHAQWNIADIAAFGGFDDDDDDVNMMHNNPTMTRIKFESKLQSLMIAIMDKKYPSNNDLHKLQSKHYIKYVWTQYNNFFLNCLEKAKQFKRFMALSCVLKDSVLIIKENGVSAIRNMDHAEQIEVYFDRYRDESDELNDFSEPPLRLHKFIAFCHDNNKNNIYHWFVACTWFYYQNNSVFDAINDQDIISDTFAALDFDAFMAKHKHEIKHHTKKQLMRLYQIQPDDFLRDIILLFTSSQKKNENKMEIMDEIWNETGLMSCVESSFASIVAARYSLLRSVYITCLYLQRDSVLLSNLQHNNVLLINLSKLLKGYFVLSYLSSSVYETKQYLGIFNTNYGQFREELLSNLQSSFRCGLAVAHYLRYKKFKITNENAAHLYFESPLNFTITLINNIFYKNKYIDLVYNVVEFMFIERQFEALQKILSFIHYISPLFKYLLARCYIEMDQMSQFKMNYMDRYAVKLINKCTKDLKAKQINEFDKKLLGFILSGSEFQQQTDNEYEGMIDVYHLAPKDAIYFPSKFIQKRENNSKKKQMKQRMVLSSNAASEPEYEWAIILAFYFHIIKLYKNVLAKPQIVISFAKNGIQLIRKLNNKNNNLDFDEDEKEENNLQDTIEKVREYSGVNSKRAQKLCVTLNCDLEAILLSIYKSNFILEIVFESLKMEKYDAAYKYLIQFDDLFCAKTAIKAYVSSCCKEKKMEPILKQNWNESKIQFNEWRKYLLSFKKSNNIWMKALNYKCLVELIIYNFALQFAMEDSFCFDLLYTFAMNHKEYQSAAKYMLEYAIRIEQYIQKKTASTQKLQYHCLCHVLSAMDLLAETNRNKYLLLDFKFASNNNSNIATNLIFNKHENIVTYKQIKQYYIFIESKNYLLSCLDAANNNNAAEEQIANLNIKQTATELYRNAFYAQSLLLLDVFDCDASFIFDKMIQILLFGADDEVLLLTWDAFEALLLDYDNDKNHYKYTLNALRTMLSFICQTKKEEDDDDDELFVIPSFVYNQMEQLNDSQIDILIIPLIELLLEFGQIQQSIQIFRWTLNKTQISIQNENYNYQNHSFWKIAQKLHAYCNTLSLNDEANKLIQSLANWIARPQ